MVTRVPTVATVATVATTTTTTTTTVMLAIDTATDAVTVALADGTRVLAASHRVDRLRHGELLAPAVERVLRDAALTPGELTAVAVGVGPGPFTGLRIGLAFATSMASVLGIPVIGVCTLDVLAFAVEVDGPFAVATDARRREVYWAEYASPGVRLGEPRVESPASVATAGPVAGNGPLLYPEHFPHAVAPEYPHADDLARAVALGSIATLPTTPLYLRRPDATVPTTRKRVT